MQTTIRKRHRNKKCIQYFNCSIVIIGLIVLHWSVTSSNSNVNSNSILIPFSKPRRLLVIIKGSENTLTYHLCWRWILAISTCSSILLIQHSKPTVAGPIQLRVEIGRNVNFTLKYFNIHAEFQLQQTYCMSFKVLLTFCLHSEGTPQLQRTTAQECN